MRNLLIDDDLRHGRTGPDLADPATGTMSETSTSGDPEPAGRDETEPVLAAEAALSDAERMRAMLVIAGAIEQRMREFTALLKSSESGAPAPARFEAGASQASGAPIIENDGRTVE